MTEVISLNIDESSAYLQKILTNYDLYEASGMRPKLIIRIADDTTSAAELILRKEMGLPHTTALPPRLVRAAKQRLVQHDVVAQNALIQARDGARLQVSRILASRNYELEFLSKVEALAASAIDGYVDQYPAIFVPDDESSIVHDALSGRVLIDYSGQATRDGLDVTSLLAVANHAELFYFWAATKQQAFGVAVARELLKMTNESSRIHQTVVVDRATKKVHQLNTQSSVSVSEAMQYVSTVENAFAYGDLSKLQRYSSEHVEVTSLLGAQYGALLFR